MSKKFNIKEWREKHLLKENALGDLPSDKLIKMKWNPLKLTEAEGYWDFDPGIIDTFERSFKKWGIDTEKLNTPKDILGAALFSSLYYIYQNEGKEENAFKEIEKQWTESKTKFDKLIKTIKGDAQKSRYKF